MRTQLERISNSSSKKILNVCHVLSSWHRDQWRKDLVVICMKTGNLGIYLNFKNLSKTWHVNTNREQIHNGLFLSIHFHLLSNVMLFVEKLKYAKKSRLARLKIILSGISVENSLRGDNDMVGEINLICLHFLDFL